MAINVSMVQGESRLIDVTVTDAEGAATDITGATIEWTAGSIPYAAGMLTKAGAVTEGTEGKFRITIEPADTATVTGALFHWSKLTLSDGSVMTLFLGTFTVAAVGGVGVTAEAFKVRFPELAEVPDGLVAMVLAEAVSEIGEQWHVRDRARAQMLLTAHRLTLEGEPARSVSGQASAMLGAVKRRKVGDVETEFAGVAGGGAGAAGGFSSTVYGQQYLALVRLNFAGVAVV